MDRPQVGDVFVVPMNESNGITPQGDEEYRKKFFVVLGFDNKGNAYGGLIINSRINQRLPLQIKELHLPIKQEHNQFLRYNSFVDCARLKELPVSKLIGQHLLGHLFRDDLELAKRSVINSPVESQAQLKRFGLI